MNESAPTPDETHPVLVDAWDQQWFWFQFPGYEAGYHFAGDGMSRDYVEREFMNVREA